MSKIEQPKGVMLDLLSSFCSGYTPAQIPTLFNSNFEAGRSIGIIRAQRLGKRLIKCKEQDQLQSILKEALEQLRIDGYGDCQIENFEFRAYPWHLKIVVRIPKSICQSGYNRTSFHGLCSCYQWFWRGLMNGLICETAWITKISPVTPMTDLRLPSDDISRAEMRIIEARAKSHFLEKNNYASLTIEI